VFAGLGSALFRGVGEERVELGGLDLGLGLLLVGFDQERVDLGLVLVRAGDGRGQGQPCRLLVRGAGPVLEERVVLRLAQTLDGLPGEGLERRPPLALLERGDVLRRARPGRDELADDTFSTR
jgi:hypothetical protein